MLGRLGYHDLEAPLSGLSRFMWLYDTRAPHMHSQPVSESDQLNCITIDSLISSHMIINTKLIDIQYYKTHEVPKANFAIIKSILCIVQDIVSCYHRLASLLSVYLQFRGQLRVLITFGDVLTWRGPSDWVSSLKHPNTSDQGGTTNTSYSRVIFNAANAFDPGREKGCISLVTLVAAINP